MSKSKGAHPAAAGTVGYGRPPVKHQFKKGVSGNPRGRPRKDRPSPAYARGYAELDDILLTEALRPVTVIENDQQVTMPMIQAVLRSLGVAALKGHHRSQIILTEMVRGVQSARLEERREAFYSMMNYKEFWRKEIEQAARLGQPLPEPVPHPDDIVVDLNTLEVRFNGPMTHDEKAGWDQMLDRKAQALEEIEYYQKMLKRPGKYKDSYEADIRSEQEIVEIVDAFFPSKEIRRRPGFDIQEWREADPVFREVVAKVTRRRRERAKTRA